jgi:hypothetical protein
MGLFSAHRRGFRPAGFRSPIGIHSELSLVAMARHVALAASRAARGLGSGATAATNDARVVGVLLLMAAAALAFEMAQSFH